MVAVAESSQTHAFELRLGAGASAPGGLQHASKGSARSHSPIRANIGGAPQVSDRQASLDLHAFYAPWGEVALQRCLEPFERRMHELEKTLTDKDTELDRLRKRIAELEGRLTALDGASAASGAGSGAPSGSSRALFAVEQAGHNTSPRAAPNAEEVPAVSRGSVLRIVREEVNSRRNDSEGSRPTSARGAIADAENRENVNAPSAASRKNQPSAPRGPSPRTLSRERLNKGNTSAKRGTFFGTYTTASKEMAEGQSALRHGVSQGVHAASTGQLPNAYHLGGGLGTMSTGSLPISPALSTGSSSVASNAARGRRPLSAPKAGRAFR